jgi:uncharacterized protein with GYD domain
MPLYILVGRWTNRGIETIKKSPARLKRAKELAHSLGAEVESFVLLMGRYDFGLWLRAPDDDTAAKFVLAARSEGNVRIETMRAFTEEEYLQIIAAIP